MTSCCPPPRMRWSGVIGAIARCKRVSTGCGRKRRSVRVWRWICGVKPTPMAVNKPWQHCIVHGLAKPGALATVSHRVDILNHAPVRPLDYTYLKALTPMAQRFYELLSYKMFAALKHRQPHATLRYSDYCLLSTQQRYMAYDHVKKQMYKVHQPHISSGYIVKGQYEATTDADGHPDWLMHYTPGPKAQAEYAAFTRQPGAEVAALTLPVDADQEDLLATVTREPPAAPPPAAV